MGSECIEAVLLSSPLQSSVSSPPEQLALLFMKTFLLTAYIQMLFLQ